MQILGVKILDNKKTAIVRAEGYSDVYIETSCMNISI
jgi:hypothetical protein